MARTNRYKKSKNMIEYDLSLLFGILVFIYTKSVIKGVVTIIVCLLSVLAYYYYKSLRNRRTYLNSGIDLVDKFTGEEFEDFLLVHFKNLGYSGKTTKKTNDYGADLILYKEKNKIVVQAKRWGSKVGIDAIQQIIGARSYYKANKSIVITNNYFTKNAINLAASSNVELWDRTKLLEIMGKFHSKNLIEESFNVEELKERHLCKKCGSDMIIKNGKFGCFYGCLNYPKCKYTENKKM